MKVRTESGETPPSDPARKGRFLFPIAPTILISVGAAVLAALILCLMLIPVSVWRHPVNDAVYKGFDPNLIFVSPTGPTKVPGAVTVSPDTLTLDAAAGSHPTVHLLTTPLSFSASFDVVVTAAPPGSVPLRIGLWSPENGTGYFLLFDRDGGHVIRSEVIVNGRPAQDLVAGTAMNDDVLGQYNLGQSYHVIFDVNQINRAIGIRVLSPDSIEAGSTITPAQAPQVFNAFRPSLTLSSSADVGSSSVSVRNYVLTLPNQPSSSAEATVKIDDPLARLLVEGVLAACIAICLIVALLTLIRRLGVPWTSGLPLLARRAKTIGPAAAWLVLAVGLYMLANLPLFGVASLHYDVLSSRVWSYVAFKDGIPDIYYRTLIVPAAAAWLGIPVHEAVFPYGITKAYYYFVVGWAYHLGLNPSGPANINTFSFEVLLKAFNVLFGFADAVLIYLILRRLVTRRSALVSALLFGLNPALVLVMSVWGSTESISAFFVLGSIWLAEGQRPLGAWLMLVAAAFTRPQMLVLAFLLGLVYFRKFGVRDNVNAISWTLIVSFIVMAPFSLSISPSLPFDYVFRTYVYHFANGQADQAALGIAPAFYSVWTLPLLWVSGLHGLDRMWTPSTVHVFGSVTYGQFGAGLSVVFLLVVGTIILLSKRISTSPGQYFPVVAFGTLGWLLVTPGLISRYLVYGIVVVILCRRAFSTRGYLLAVGVVTVIACISIYGHLADDFLGYSGGANVLSPLNNGVSHGLFALFSADWFITAAAEVNLVLLGVLGYTVWKIVRKDPARGLAVADNRA
jgi:hypothetical protein